MTKILILLSIALLSGCAGMADSMDKAAGLGAISEEVSTFDNAKIIRVSPTWLYVKADDWSPSQLKMGAQWVSSAPDLIGLIIKYSGSVGMSTSVGAPSYVGISKIELNIDGAMSSYEAGSGTKLSNSGVVGPTHEIYTASENIIAIPYPTFEAMMAAKDCRVRIHTSQGLVDANFSIVRGGSGGSAAAGAMAPFLVKVKAARAG